MVQNIAALFKMGFEYLIYISMALAFVTLVFLGYAKIKTGKSWQDVLNLYLEIVAKTFVCTGLLLLGVFILVEYMPIMYIVTALLIISSISILCKYLYMAQSKKMMLIDGTIVLVNIYFSYLLIMPDRFDIDHYIVLGIAGFSFFLYQQVKKIGA